VALVVDGAPVDLARTVAYKGMMYSDVPNLASAFGYTNASWTLKCDLVAGYVCRLLNHMARRGYVQCTRAGATPPWREEPVLDLTSGLRAARARRAAAQGDRAPWRLHQNYVRDLVALRLGPVDDPALEFRAAGDRPRGDVAGVGAGGVATRG
jgi:cation diffusion facilitator CzcD-associated flavoprotein CzcO